MNLLLDSHALIWTMDNPARLSAPAFAAIQDSANGLSISAATVWEISIKTGLNKLKLANAFLPWIRQAMTEIDLKLLPITAEYADVQASLPDHHRDPFDRFLIAQAIVESLTIVSIDPWFDSYNVKRLW